jgi:hypothetical protein
LYSKTGVTKLAEFFIEAQFALGIEVKSPELQNSKFSLAQKATSRSSFGTVENCCFGVRTCSGKPDECPKKKYSNYSYFINPCSVN